MADLSRYHPDDIIDAERAAVLVAYANQIDPRVQVNVPTRDVWAESLHDVKLGVARKAIVDYYAKAQPEQRGFDVTVIRPAIIREAWREHRRAEDQEQWLLEQRDKERQAVPMPERLRKQLHRMVATPKEPDHE